MFGMVKAFGKQLDFLGTVPFEGTVVQNKATPVGESGLFMYGLKFGLDDGRGKKRGELVPVDFRGLEESVDTILSYLVRIVAFLVLVDRDVLEGNREQIGKDTWYGNTPDFSCPTFGKN
jgi:hypothetical protein